MNFLSIDCSTEIGFLFIKVENKTFNQTLQSDKYNNDLLMKRILDFLDKNNLKLEYISKIFVNQGPGNFSGLRGSLATAKGISLAKKIRLFGYNTFLWSCTKFFNQNKNIFSIINFRGKYFIKNYSKDLKIVSKAKEVTKEEIIKNNSNSFKVVPRHLIKSFDKDILKLKNLNVVDLDHNELEFLQSKGLLDEDFIKPLYLS